MIQKAVILLFPGLLTLVNAQRPFKTVVPQKPVVVGESFSVQYIVADANTTANFIAPVFRGFRMVAGPAIYLGSTPQNGVSQSKNFVFTLVALKPGKQIIPGAIISINGKQVRSEDNFIEVVSKETAAHQFGKEMPINSDYFLRAVEDVKEKMRQNLFLKVMVDKRSCFVGEPILVTFKLYSRLESKSDIIKNPGFYGFTVFDIVNLSDRLVATENVQGKTFDVHTIRKVQLYPLHAGVFTIDPMEVKNRVEFSRSVVSKKTEQEISEGVLNMDFTEIPETNTETFESNISTVPIVITVKPTPEKNKPAVFNEAVGSFIIAATNVRDGLVENEEGIVEIVVSGKGNFIQLNVPIVTWPAGIEGFEPVIKDSWNKETMPLAGSRIFRYPFVSSVPGVFTIPPVSFSFFNADSGYKTIATQPVILRINKREKRSAPAPNQNNGISTDGSKKYWLIGGGALVVVLTGLLLFFKKKKAGKNHAVQRMLGKKEFLSVDELFTAVNLQSGDNMFYISLYQAVWRFFGFYYNLSGSEMNKENLLTKMREDKLEKSITEEVQNILQQCEAGMFTKATLSVDKSLLLQEAKKIIEKINNPLL